MQQSLYDQIRALELEVRALKARFSNSSARRSISGTGTTVTPHGLLSAIHTDTEPFGPTRGALIRGNDDDHWEHYPLGSSGHILTSDGNDAVWAAPVAGDLVTDSTTDATPNALNTVAVATDTTVLIEVKVVGLRTGGSAGSAGDSAGYIISGLFKNISGTVSLVGSLSLLHVTEDQPAWDATLSVVGTDVILYVTGAVDNNITWSSRTSTMVVS